MIGGKRTDSCAEEAAETNVDVEQMKLNGDGKGNGSILKYLTHGEASRRRLHASPTYTRR